MYPYGSGVTSLWERRGVCAHAEAAPDGHSRDLGQRGGRLASFRESSTL